MSARISNNLEFLRLFCQVCKGKARRRDLMQFANREEINSICECVEKFSMWKCGRYKTKETDEQTQKITPAIER